MAGTLSISSEMLAIAFLNQFSPIKALIKWNLKFYVITDRVRNSKSFLLVDETVKKIRVGPSIISVSKREYFWRIDQIESFDTCKSKILKMLFNRIVQLYYWEKLLTWNYSAKLLRSQVCHFYFIGLLIFEKESPNTSSRHNTTFWFYYAINICIIAT